MKKIFHIISLSFFLFLFPVLATGHVEGEGVVVGEYKIEFGQVPDNATVGVQQSLLIGVEDAEGFSPIGDIPLWIRISSPDGIIFSSNNFISNTEKLVTVSFLPQTAGEYTVDVELQLQEGGEDAYSASFDFTVAPSDASNNVAAVGSSNNVAAVTNSSSKSDEVVEQSNNLQIATIVLLIIAIVLFIVIIMRTRSVRGPSS